MCFFGSTNNEDFLKDPTGSRRFFPVPVRRVPASDVFLNPKRKAEFQAIVDQLWAEAVELYKAGESLILSPEAEEIANGKREEFTEKDPQEGLVFEYVNRKFPANWDDMYFADRLDFINEVGLQPEGTEIRDSFCAFEIWVECLGNKRTDFNVARAKQVANMLKRAGFKADKQKNVKLYGKQTMFVRR